MAPRSSRANGNDTDTSMADASEPTRQLPTDQMVRELYPEGSCNSIQIHPVLFSVMIDQVTRH
jgi:hypothetical protein